MDIILYFFSVGQPCTPVVNFDPTLLLLTEMAVNICIFDHESLFKRNYLNK